MEEPVETKDCSRCGQPSVQFASIEAGLRLALSAAGHAEELPPLICQNCHSELSSLVSQGVKLRLEQGQREKNKMMMWKNRVNLIKQGRQYMLLKKYSDAAVSYEKYLRVLEIIYNKGKGELAPDVFNNSKRSKEITIIASVYWDLMRIYDISPQYGDRMKYAADMLAKFVPYSTLYPDIMKKAESFSSTAKNQNVVRAFLKSTKGRSGRCFIASAAFGAPLAPEVQIFIGFRDNYLKTKLWGRKFVTYYYRYSPPLAQGLANRPWLKPPVRLFLRLTALCLKNHVEKHHEFRDLKNHVES